MNEAIKAILAELPSYLFNLVRLILGPGKFVEDMDFAAARKLTNITKALTFTSISYILVEVIAFLGVGARFAPGVNLQALYFTRFALSVIVFVGFFIVLVIVLRMAGAKVEIDRLLVIHAYYSGVLWILFQVAVSIAEGWMAFQMRIGRSIDQQVRQGEMTTVYMLMAFAGAIVFIWGLIAWQAYGRIGQLSLGRSISAMILSWIFSIPIVALAFFMMESFLPAKPITPG